MILPPHSTHRLQPLDVGIFSPLATAYSKEIDNLVQSSMGFSRVTKRSFWRLFRATWNNAPTSDNIVSAFKTPGIYPVDESRVLSKLPKTSTPPESDEERSWATPRNVPALRRTVRAYHKGDIDEDPGVDLIIRGAEKLAIENEILKHETKGLRTALVEVAKRHKRGKAMGLIDKERPGDAQFFSPSKVTAARARAEQKESDKEEAEVRKEEERLARIAERDRKAREVQDRKEQRERGRLERERRKQQEQELRQIAAQARSDSQTANKCRNKGKQPMLPPLTRSTEQGEASSENQQETQTTRSERQFRRPKRFEA